VCLIALPLEQNSHLIEQFGQVLGLGGVPLEQFLLTPLEFFVVPLLCLRLGSVAIGLPCLREEEP
jgi:hypothetical protein